MKQRMLCLFGFLILTACNGDDGGGSPGGAGGLSQNNKGGISEWQSSALGQEGHGGDAIVCFDIPVERALYKVNTKPENDCPPNQPCPGSNSSTSPGQPGQSIGIVWRMTDEGRRSIRSAKPLEQYLGERVASKKTVIDQLQPDVPG